MPASSHGTLTIYTDVNTTGLSNGLKNITKSVNKLTSLMSFTVGIVGMLRLGKEAVNAASKLQEYRNVAEVTFGRNIELLDELLAHSIDTFGMSKLTATEAASGYMAMGRAAGIANKQSAEMAIGLTEYMADFASFYDLSHERARTALAAVYTGETETLKQYGIMLQEVNLQQYENEHGLGRSIKTMSAAEKAQLRYNYIMHVGADAVGDFARTSNNWANQTRVLTERWRELLIKIGDGLITVLTPGVRLLNQLIDATMRYTDVLGDAIAVIFGIEWQSLSEQQQTNAEVSEEAAESQDELAKATNNAAKAAKKALQPFDKLNNISTNNSTTEVKTDDVEDGASKVEESTGIITSAIDSLYKLGQYLSQSLQNVLDSIEWEKVYEKLSNFGIGLTDFLNGALSTDALSSIATTLANSLNSIVQFAISGFKNLDWSELGNSIGDSINTFFDSFDAKALAEALNRFAHGIKTTLLAALNTIDWSDIKQFLTDIFSNLEVETITLIVGAIAIPKLSKLLLSAIGSAIGGKTFALGVKKLFKKVFSWDLLGTKDLVGKVIDAFKLALGKAGTLKEAFAAVFGPIGAVVTGVLTVVTGSVTAIVNFVSMLVDGFSWIKEVLMVIGIAIAAVGAVILGAPALIAAAVAAIVAAVLTAIVVIKDNWAAIKEFFINTWDIIKEKFMSGIEAIKGFFSNLFTRISEIWKSVTDWFTQYVIEPIASFFEGLVTRISQFFEGCWIIIQAVWMLASEWFNDNVVEPIEEFFEPIIDTISGIFVDLWEKIQETWSGIATWFEENVVVPIAATFDTIVSAVTEKFIEVKEQIKSTWSDITSWFKTDIIEPLQKVWRDAGEAIAGFFTGIWNSLRVGLVNVINGLITDLEGAINDIIDGINDLIRGFNNLVSWAGDLIGKSGGISYVPNISLARVPVPKLATGAVIPPNKQFLAVLGDQKHGTNVEAPLDTIKQALIEALQTTGVGGDNGDIVIKIGEDEIFRAVRRKNNEYINRTGQSAFGY